MCDIKKFYMVLLEYAKLMLDVVRAWEKGLLVSIIMR